MIVSNAITVKGISDIASVLCESEFFGYKSAVSRSEDDYNYSVHIIRDIEAGLYRLYHGGRWQSEIGDGDHVLQSQSSFGQADTWSESKRPEFLQGAEEGESGQWFSGNYLEPEVIKVDGQYFMYTQVEISEGQPIDIPGQIATIQSDRIQLHTSRDGSNWTRFSRQRGVIINIDNPTEAHMHHQEVLYVPFDSDGLPFWMYIYRNGGNEEGHFRMRSNDPTTFDWNLREKTSFPEIGNQIGYAFEAPGGPLFVRITFDSDDTNREVPCLHFSRDGLSWVFGNTGRVLLDGSKDNNRNKNCYFLGFSTQNGTGRFDRLGENQFQLIYGASTSNSPIVPEIFKSQIGVGMCRITLNPPLELFEGKLLFSDGLPLALVIEGKRLQFENAVGSLFSNTAVNVTADLYEGVPYAASLKRNTRCIGIDGQPPCFVLDDGRKWPVSCLRAIEDVGSSIEKVSPEVYNSFPTGPALICI